MRKAMRGIGTLRALARLFFLLAGFSLLWVVGESFVLRNRFVEWTHASGYRPATFRIDRAVFVPPARATADLPGFHVEGKVDGQFDEAFDMRGYLGGLPTSQADAENHFPAGMTVRVLYNPALSIGIWDGETLRVVRYDEHFREHQRAGFLRMLLITCGPTVLLVGVGLAFRARARARLLQADLEIEDGEGLERAQAPTSGSEAVADAPAGRDKWPRSFKAAAADKYLFRRVTAILFGLVLICCALFIIMIGTGFTPYPPSENHAPGWVVTASGIFFLLGGLLLVIDFGTGWAPANPTAIPPPPSRVNLLTQLLLGFPLMVCFAAGFNWIAFGPGDRSGTVSIGFLGFFLPAKAGPVATRIVWGAFALGADCLIVVLTVRLLRQVRDRFAARS